MEMSDEFEKGAGYNAHSSLATLKAALQTRITLLQFQPKTWKTLTEQFFLMGIFVENKPSKDVVKAITDYATKELCPYKSYIRTDDDGDLINDQGKKLDRKAAPRDETYIRPLLYWLVSSPWSEDEARSEGFKGKSVWLPEDWPKIRDDLALFEKLKKRTSILELERNIRLYETPLALEEAIEKYRVANPRANRLIDEADLKFKNKPNEVEIIWTSSEKTIDAEGNERPKLRIIHVKTEAASRAYGKDTRWCTAYQDKPTDFPRYSSRGLIILHAFTGARWQLHLDDMILNNEFDIPVDPCKVLSADAQAITAILAHDFSSSYVRDLDFYHMMSSPEMVRADQQRLNRTGIDCSVKTPEKRILNSDLRIQTKIFFERQEFEKVALYLWLTSGVREIEGAPLQATKEYLARDVVDFIECVPYLCKAASSSSELQELILPKMEGVIDQFVKNSSIGFGALYGRIRAIPKFERVCCLMLERLPEYLDNSLNLGVAAVNVRFLAMGFKFDEQAEDALHSTLGADFPSLFRAFIAEDRAAWVNKGCAAQCLGELTSSGKYKDRYKKMVIAEANKLSINDDYYLSKGLLSIVDISKDKRRGSISTIFNDAVLYASVCIEHVTDAVSRLLSFEEKRGVDVK